MQMGALQLGREYWKIKQAQKRYEAKYGLLGVPDYGLDNLLTACANKQIDPRLMWVLLSDEDRKKLS